jgi:hypothetical protein
MKLRSFLLFALLAVSDCGYFDACQYEIRSLQASGNAIENGVVLVAVQLTVSEQREIDPNKSIYWLLTGDSMKGHVISAVFKDSSDPSRVLLSLPVSSASQATLSEGARSEKTDAVDLSGFFDLVSAGRGIVEIQTDFYGIEVAR